eukprot:5403715-Amphidinium_carterae.1
MSVCAVEGGQTSWSDLVHSELLRSFHPVRAQKGPVASDKQPRKESDLNVRETAVRPQRSTNR